MSTFSHYECTIKFLTADLTDCAVAVIDHNVASLDVRAHASLTKHDHVHVHTFRHASRVNVCDLALRARIRLHRHRVHVVVNPIYVD